MAGFLAGECVCLCAGVSVSMAGFLVGECVCLCVGVSVSMAGFLAGEFVCEAASVTESVVDRAVRAAEEKQQNVLNTSQPSHGQFAVILYQSRSPT